MIVLCILVLIYFIFNITSIVNMFMLSIEKQKVSLGWRPWNVPRASILSLLNKCIFIALFSILFHQICAWNTKKLAVLLALGFWRHVPKTSYKGPKVTSGGWRSRDVPRASILNISTKRISVVKFSVLVHQMCVLDTRKLVTAYFFSLGETS